LQLQVKNCNFLPATPHPQLYKPRTPLLSLHYSTTANTQKQELTLYFRAIKQICFRFWFILNAV